MSDGRAAITANGLTKSFGDVVALHDLTFSVAVGEVVGLLGHNGAGKTTTIRVLNGLLGADAGSATVLGDDPSDRGPAIRARTGVLTETPSLDERLSAHESLVVSARLFGVAPGRQVARARELLEQFGLAERARDRIAGFSRGMKQRLALARALVHDPELLFLDEPTAALDPIAAREVHDLIGRYSADHRRTVVISTHNLVEAQRLCDRVFILRQGRLVAAGAPRDLVRQVVSHGGLSIEVASAAMPLALETLTSAGHRARGEADDALVVEDVTRADTPGILASLVAAGVDVYRVSPAEPTLEDVYFALYADQPSPEPSPEPSAEA